MTTLLNFICYLCRQLITFWSRPSLDPSINLGLHDIFDHSSDLSTLGLSPTHKGVFKADIVTGLISSFVCFSHIHLEKLNKDLLFQTASQLSYQ